MTLKAYARLLETADFSQTIKFVDHAAQRIFGNATVSTINIASGQPHVHVTLTESPELSKVKYFAKLLTQAQHLHPKVIGVSPDRDHGPNAFRVDFSRG